jgi:nitroreductase
MEFLDVVRNRRSIRREFGIPDDRMMVGLVAIGYRDADEVPAGSGVSRQRRPLSEQLHHNGW